MATKTIAAKKLTRSKSEVQVTDDPPVKGILALKPIREELVTFTIRGTAPLIVNKFSNKIGEQMLRKHMGLDEPISGKKVREKKDPDALYEASKEKTRSGKDAIRALAIKCAMVSARIFLGQKISEAFIQGAVHVIGDADGLIPLKYGSVSKRQDMVRVGGKFGEKGQPDIRFRAQYDDWGATITIRYRKDIMSQAQVAVLLQNAGASIGLCEWRPQCNGSFGTFEVV